MAFFHGSYHFIALLIYFYTSKSNSFIAEYLHQILKNKTMRITIWIIISTITILCTMTWSIKYVEYLFRRVSAPILLQTFFESSNNIFRKVSPTSCLYFRDKSLYIINFFCKIFDGKSLFTITMISISNETYFHLKVTITAVAGNNIINNCFQCISCSFNPTAHRGRAVK